MPCGRLWQRFTQEVWTHLNHPHLSLFCTWTSMTYLAKFGKLLIYNIFYTSSNINMLFSGEKGPNVRRDIREWWYYDIQLWYYGKAHLPPEVLVGHFLGIFWGGWFNSYHAKQICHIWSLLLCAQKKKSESSTVEEIITFSSGYVCYLTHFILQSAWFSKLNNFPSSSQLWFGKS